MHDDEQHDKARADEVDTARRLSSAKDVKEPGADGVKARRHRKAGQDHHRDQEYDAQVGEPLQRIVSLCGRAGWMLQLHMFHNGGRYRFDIGCRGTMSLFR